ncbi:MAG: hypothetical protein MZW92_62110 [Comamonadaceae bacterium]|nr:hypothetical protein [Comamonadaceae bacterium]
MKLDKTALAVAVARRRARLRRRRAAARGPDRGEEARLRHHASRASSRRTSSTTRGRRSASAKATTCSTPRPRRSAPTATTSTTAAGFNILSIQTRLAGKITGPGRPRGQDLGLHRGRVLRHVGRRHQRLPPPPRLPQAQLGPLRAHDRPVLAPDVRHRELSRRRLVQHRRAVPALQPQPPGPLHPDRSARLSLAATALAQRDFASNGPDGASSAYLRNAALPEFNLKLQYAAKNEARKTETVAGIGGDVMRHRAADRHRRRLRDGRVGHRPRRHGLLQAEVGQVDLEGRGGLGPEPPPPDHARRLRRPERRRRGPPGLGLHADRHALPLDGDHDQRRAVADRASSPDTPRTWARPTRSPGRITPGASTSTSSTGSRRASSTTSARCASPARPS